MVDTVQMRLQRSRLTKNQIEKLIGVLTNIKVNNRHQQIGDTEYNKSYIEGNYKGFNFKIGSKTVTANGSLVKYFYGNNVQCLPFSEIGTAIKQLSKATGLPWLKADLQRVDIAECVIVNHNVQHYFAYLDDTPGYSRNMDVTKLSHGVRFLKDNIKLCFYDKTVEAVRVPGFIKNFSTNRVIRIEARIMKNVRRTLYNKTKKFGVVNLLSHTYHKRLAEFWQEHYAAIIKRRIIYEHGEVLRKKNADEYLMALAMRLIGGLSQWFCILDTMTSNNHWTTKAKSDAKKDYRRKYSSEIVTLPNAYIKELDDKVHEGYIYQFIKKHKV